MDYPVLVNPGKPLRAVMKKKTKTATKRRFGNRQTPQNRE